MVKRESYEVLHGVTWCYMVLHGVTWCYMVLHGVTWCYMVLHGVTFLDSNYTSLILGRHCIAAMFYASAILHSLYMVMASSIT